jgi:hypothetical protein
MKEELKCSAKKYINGGGHHLCIKRRGHNGPHTCCLRTGLNKRCKARWETRIK